MLIGYQMMIEQRYEELVINIKDYLQSLDKS